MSDLTPTRSLLIALADERRTMREGYAFLDEKCLLLAGEMLRQVRLHQSLSRELARAAGSVLARRWRPRCTPWSARRCRSTRRRRRDSTCASSRVRCSVS